MKHMGGKNLRVKYLYEEYTVEKNNPFVFLPHQHITASKSQEYNENKKESNNTS